MNCVCYFSRRYLIFIDVLILEHPVAYPSYRQPSPTHPRTDHVIPTRTGPGLTVRSLTLNSARLGVTAKGVWPPLPGRSLTKVAQAVCKWLSWPDAAGRSLNSP